MSIERILRKISLMAKDLSDDGMKLLVSLVRSAAFDLLYSVWEIICGIYYHSYWFITLGCYYLLLMLMHMILLQETHGRKMIRIKFLEIVEKAGLGIRTKKEGKEAKRTKEEADVADLKKLDVKESAVKESETKESLEKEVEFAGWKQYRTCGILLLLMNFILSGIVVLAVVNHQGSHYAGYLIYAMAAYTFYKTGMAIRNLVKYRRSQDPVVMASKIINFVSVMISILSLEIAMNMHFGEEEEFFRMMTIMTGTGVCLVISATAIRMIITGQANYRVCLKSS